jgi:hypothetical protein
MAIQEFRGVTPPLSTVDSEIEIDIKNYGRPRVIEVVRVTVEQVSGTAANYQFSIGSRPGFAAYSIHEKYLSTVEASTDILDETDVSAFMSSSDDGKLYFKFSPDVGSNNIYVYSIMYRF